MNLKTFWLNIRRRILLRRFRCFDIEYHAQHLGKAMADEIDEHQRQYENRMLREGIQKICDKHNISHNDLRLIEAELNEYINRLVNKAHDEQKQKLMVREFVDTRIKVKRADTPGDNGNLAASEPEAEL